MDNALCGGGDTGADISSTAVPISSAAVSMIKAAIFMGDPRYIAGLPYNVGTCTAQGVCIIYLPPIFTFSSLRQKMSQYIISPIINLRPSTSQFNKQLSVTTIKN
jgi:hypothetical protein